MKKRNSGPSAVHASVRQRTIMEFVEAFVARHGYPPSQREIAAAVKLKSVSTVSYHLRRLREMGLLSWDPGRPRTAKLRPFQAPAPAPGRGRGAARRQPVTRVPLVGSIAAGIPIAATQTAEEAFDLPRMLTGEGDLIMLGVRGDSMAGAAIADGDWVVVRRAPDAENGDIVAAMLDSDTTDGAEATVKTLRKENGRVWLMPQNPDYMPIPGDTATLIGKVVTVLRSV